MAAKEHLDVLKAGVLHWNQWRSENLEIDPDLEEADLRNSELAGINFWRTNLYQVDLSHSNLIGARIVGANLTRTKLIGANLEGVNFTHSSLLETKLDGAIIKNCRVYGAGIWNISLTDAIQKDIIITRYDEPNITVDDIEIAQFIYLLLRNEKIRSIIDTITSKVVLILGRFTPERKAILDALREELRKNNYLPVVFDFDKPANRDLTETISTLAHMARFVIAEITEARSIPQELMTIVPNLPSVPIQPLLRPNVDSEYGMFEHFKRYNWVLPPFLYKDTREAIAALQEKIIDPVETKIDELRK